MDTPTESFMTVSEAAKALAVHQNTIRKRIKTGRYTVEWAPSSHGPQQLIPRSQIYANGGVVETLTESTSLTFIDRPPEPDLHQVLSQVITRMEATMKDNGRLEAELAAARDENQRLRELLNTRSWWKSLPIIGTTGKATRDARLSRVLGT